MEQVVLVDKNDNKVGLMEKLAAHRAPGHLHRAISVLLYRKKNGKTEVLLQQRGKTKLLWPLYWADTTSTHPRDGESLKACAVRRLKEEMGIEINEQKLRVVFPLVYAAKYNDEFLEQEVDYVLVGQWDGEPKLNKREADDYRWVEWATVKKERVVDADKYAPWLSLIVKELKFEKELFDI